MTDFEKKKFYSRTNNQAAYEEGFERTFGPKCEVCGMLLSRHTERGDMVWTDGYDLIACSNDLEDI